MDVVRLTGVSVSLFPAGGSQTGDALLGLPVVGRGARRNRDGVAGDHGLADRPPAGLLLAVFLDFRSHLRTVAEVLAALVGAGLPVQWPVVGHCYSLLSNG